MGQNFEKVRTVAELQTLTNHVADELIFVLDTNDFFKFVAESTTAHDGTDTIRPDNILAVNAGRWIRIKFEADDLEIGPGGPHADSHEDGGADEMDLTGMSGLLADPQTPILHAETHQQGGTDPINVDGLSGMLADAQNPTTHQNTHEQGGDDEISVQGLNGLLNQAQTPLEHKASHVVGGSDAFVDTDLLDAVVQRLRTTTGPTDLLLGAVADGEFLKRSGAAIVGDTPAGGGGGNPIHFKVDANNNTSPATLSHTFTPTKSGIVVEGMATWNFTGGGPNTMILNANVDGVELNNISGAIQEARFVNNNLGTEGSGNYQGAKEVTVGVPITVNLVVDTGEGGTAQIMSLKITETDFENFIEVPYTGGGG